MRRQCLGNQKQNSLYAAYMKTMGHLLGYAMWNKGTNHPQVYQTSDQGRAWKRLFLLWNCEQHQPEESMYSKTVADKLPSLRHFFHPSACQWSELTQKKQREATEVFATLIFWNLIISQEQTWVDHQPATILAQWKKHKREKSGSVSVLHFKIILMLRTAVISKQN